MEIENLHQAIALEELTKLDLVVIENGKCRIAAYGDIREQKEIYQVVDDKVSIGQMANLSGNDTKFILEEDKQSNNIFFKHEEIYPMIFHINKELLIDENKEISVIIEEYIPT